MELEAQIKACDDQIAEDEKHIQEENNALEEDRKKQMELEAQIKACDNQIAEDEKHIQEENRNEEFKKDRIRHDAVTLKATNDIIETEKN